MGQAIDLPYQLKEEKAAEAQPPKEPWALEWTAREVEQQTSEQKVKKVEQRPKLLR